MSKVNVGILGATGYAGMELVRLVGQHPCLNLIEHTGRFGELSNLTDQIDVLLLATPADVSIEIIQKIRQLPIKIIDLSGAFRLPKHELHAWYGLEQPIDELAGGVHYGLSPWNMKNSAEHPIVANPGCYATAALMSLIPLLAGDIIKPGNIIIDAKSGTSGAGKNGFGNSACSEMIENFLPYKVGKHQHVPEIKNALRKITGKECDITLVTHMLPIARGIAMTIYADLNDESGVAGAYDKAYRNYPLVDAKAVDDSDNQDLYLKNVVGTAKTQIRYFIDQGKIIVFSYIDNLLKGAASQAIENVNAHYEFPAHLGLLEGEIS